MLKSWLIILVLFYPPSCVNALDVQSQKEVYLPDYTHYHDLQRMAADLHQTMEKYSDFMQIDYGYTSRNQDSQILVRLTDFSESCTNLVGSDEPERPIQLDPYKVRVLLSYGEHAREFFPVESFFHLLGNLTAALSSHPDSPAGKFSRFVFSNFDILAIVIANPDGRKFVETSHNYCWRGTSTGVDLNRNFDWRYGEKGSSSDPKDEEYRGPNVFSGKLIFFFLTVQHLYLSQSLYTFCLLIYLMCNVFLCVFFSNLVYFIFLCYRTRMQDIPTPDASDTI